MDFGVVGSLPALLRSILNSKRSAQSAVSLGGVMLIRRGRVKMHVMPDFSSVPLTTEAAINDWLRFFEFEAPLFCASVLHSHDTNGWGLRMEHTHGYALDRQVGGHFHYDTSADLIEYEAYFRPVDNILCEPTRQ
jgi:hypothetical protein